MTLLRVYRTDNRHDLKHEPINIRSDLTYEERSVGIIDSKFKELENKKVKLVKVIWQNQVMEKSDMGNRRRNEDESSLFI